eukprot:37586-Amphidinium_carterae.1
MLLCTLSEQLNLSSHSTLDTPRAPTDQAAGAILQLGIGLRISTSSLPKAQDRPKRLCHKAFSYCQYASILARREGEYEAARKPKKHIPIACAQGDLVRYALTCGTWEQ